MKRMMKSKRPFTLFAAGATLAVAATASADMIYFESSSANSTEGLGSFGGSLLFDAGGSTHGTLAITLSNTTDPSIGGYLTGLLFNFSAPNDVSVTLNNGGHFGDIAGRSAPPFGNNYRAGAAIGNHWTGGGAPHRGIAAGNSLSLNFDVTGNDVSSLSSASFFSPSDPFDFVVRFRGMAQGGSDKVPATANAAEVPAPGALALFGAALRAGRRRRRA